MLGARSATRQSSCQHWSWVRGQDGDQTAQRPIECDFARAHL